MLGAPTKRVWLTGMVALVSAGLACNFGVDLDGVFGGRVPTETPDASPTDSAPPADVVTIPKVTVAQLVLAPDFACARRIDGTVMCWGYDGPEARLGDGATFASSSPVLVRDVNDAADIAVGVNHACAVRKTGKVACWGDNSQRQIGDGSNNAAPSPREVISLDDAQSVALGSAFSCALRKEGSVVCWGVDTNGELGDGQNAARSQPMPVKGITGATQIIAMQSSACALLATGEVWCWGYEPIAGTARREPVKIGNIADAAALGGGAAASHACAITKTGTVKCWGAGGNGQLGDGKSQNSVDAVDVPGIRDATSIATGNAFTCATLKDGGKVNCWGINGWRQLGLGEGAGPSSASTPLPVADIGNAQRAAAGGNFACALSQDGAKIWCWGNNYYGLLGRGTRVIAESPVKIPTATPVTDMALGQNHGCALGPDGIASCWGRNDHVQLAAQSLPATGVPMQLGDAGGFERVVTGDEHTCVLAGDTLHCVGRGSEGQFGNNAPSDSFELQTFGESVVEPSAAGNGTCARIASGEVVCAGQNNAGQLGVNNFGNLVTPQIVRGPAVPPLDNDAAAVPATLTPVETLVVGRWHSCALDDAGRLYCWGSKNDGQCGPGGQSNEVPQQVPLPSAVISVALGNAHTCAVLDDNTVRCFGNNQWGQLSGGDPGGTTLRTPDFGGKGVTAIAAGDSHTCALMADATVSCWGQGLYGQLGGGVRADANRPMPVSGLSTVKKIFARASQSCALLGDGSLWCWGLNSFGQLGDGAVMITGVPAPVIGYE